MGFLFFKKWVYYVATFLKVAVQTTSKFKHALRMQPGVVLEGRPAVGAAVGSALSCPLLSAEQPLELPPLLLLPGDSRMVTAISFDPLHVLLSRYSILKHSGMSGESRGKTVFRGGIPPVTLIQ